MTKQTKEQQDEEIAYWEAFETGQIPRGLGLGWAPEKVIAVMKLRQERNRIALENERGLKTEREKHD